jgi:hypothetical protein
MSARVLWLTAPLIAVSQGPRGQVPASVDMRPQARFWTSVAVGSASEAQGGCEVWGTSDSVSDTVV